MFSFFKGNACLLFLLISFIAFDVEAQQPPTALEGHQSGVSSAVYSPDGKLIVTGSFDRTIKIWNAANGVQLKDLQAHNGQVLSLAMHPLGRQFVSGSRDNTLKAWDLFIPTPLNQFVAHQEKVTSIKASSDGTLLVTAGADKLAKIWNKADGMMIRELAGHNSAITHIALSKDNTQLATADIDGEVRIWNVADGSHVATLGAHAGPVSAVDFHLANATLLTASENGSTKLWNLPTVPGQVFAGNTLAVSSVAASVEKKLLVTGGADASVRVFNSETGQPIHNLAGQKGAATSVALHAESGLIASGSETGSIKLWNSADGADRLSLAGHTGPIHDIAFNLKGDQIVSAGEDKTIRIWRLPVAGRPLAGHTMPVLAVDVSTDGKTIATGSADKTVKLFNAADGVNTLTLTGHEAAISAIKLRSDNLQIASSDVTGTIQLWDAKGAAVGTLTGHAGPVNSLSYVAAGKELVSTGDDGTLRWWKLPTIEPVTLPTADESLSRIAISKDGKQYLVGGENGSLQVFDATTNAIVRPLVGQNGAVTALATSATLTATGNPEGQIRFWNNADGVAQPIIAGGHAGAIRDLAFHPMGKQVATAGEDGTIRIWNLPATPKQLAGAALAVEVTAYSNDGLLVASSGLVATKPTIVVRETTTGTVKATIVGHTAAISSMEFSPDKTKLISGSADKTSRVWNLADAAQLAMFEHPAPVTAVAFTADGLNGISGSADNSIKLWKVADAEEVRAMAGHTGAISSLVVDGTVLVSGSADKSIRIWNLADGKLIRNINNTSAVTCLDFHAAAQLIVSGGADNTVKLWKATDGTPIGNLKAESILRTSISPNGEKIAVVSATGLTICESAGVTMEKTDFETGTLRGAVFDAKNANVLAMDAKHVLHTVVPALVRMIPAHQGNATGVAWLPAGTTLVSCGEDKKLQMWNVSDGKPFATFAGATGALGDLTLSADGKFVAAAGSQLPILVWPVPAATVAVPVAAQTTITSPSPIKTLEFSPDGLQIATGTDDSVLRIWDVTSGLQLQSFAGHAAAIADVKFNLAGDKLVSAGADKTACVWSPAVARMVVASDAKIIDHSLSTDGTLLATASADKILRLFNTADGKLLNEIPLGAVAPTSVALRGDKLELAAAGADMKLYLWPLAPTGPGAVRNIELGSIPASLRYSADGTKLIAACADKQLRVIDPERNLLLESVTTPEIPLTAQFLPDGMLVVSIAANQAVIDSLSNLKTMTGHEMSVTAVSFDMAGTSVISGSADKTLRKWTIVDGVQTSVFAGTTEAITGLEISPNGTVLVASSADKFARTWNLAPVAPSVQPTAAFEHATLIHGVGINADASRIATASEDGKLRVFDLATGREAERFAGHTAPATAVVMSADGKSIFSASADKSARSWSTSVKHILNADAKNVADAAFLPDGTALMTCGSELPVKVWDIEGKPVKQIVGAAASLHRLAISHDGTILAATDIQGKTMLWTIADGALKHTIDGTMLVNDVSFSPDGKSIAVVDVGKQLRVHSTEDGTLLQNQVAETALESVCFDTDGKQLLTTSETSVHSWAFATPSAVKEFAGHTGPVYSVAFSTDGALMASSSGDNSIRTWDFESGQPAKQLAGHTAAVYAIQFSADNQQLASAAADGTVRLWNVANGTAIKQFAIEPIEGETPPAFYDVAISADSKLIAAVGMDKHIRIWTVADGKQLAPIPVTGANYRVQFQPDGQLMSCSHIGELKIVNPANGAESFSTKVAGVAFSASRSPVEKRFIVPCADGNAYFVTLP